MTAEPDNPAEGFLRFVVQHTQGDQRLDRLVAGNAGVSRREARLLIARGQVRVNDRPVRILTRPVCAGARITVQRSGQPAGASASAALTRSEHRGHADIGLLMLDRWVVAVDKPAGLLSESDDLDAPSLQSEVPKLLAARGERDKVWLVHRLDAGTTGVVLLARTAAAARILSDTFRKGAVDKRYVALCTGRLTTSRLVDAPIARLRGVRHGVAAGGKASQTKLEPLAQGSDATLVRALPRSGRTHQIRVHLAHVGHPILGDRLYGGRGYTAEAPPRPIARPMLHAHQLAVAHPKTGIRIRLAAPVPVDLVDLAIRLGIAVPKDLLPGPERGRSRKRPQDASRNG